MVEMVFGARTCTARYLSSVERAFNLNQKFDTSQGRGFWVGRALVRECCGGLRGEFVGGDVLGESEMVVNILIFTLTKVLDFGLLIAHMKRHRNCTVL